MPVVGWVISCLDARRVQLDEELARRRVSRRCCAASVLSPESERPIQQTADAIERFTQTWIRDRVRNRTGNGGR